MSNFIISDDFLRTIVLGLSYNYYVSITDLTLYATDQELSEQEKIDNTWFTNNVSIFNTKISSAYLGKIRDEKNLKEIHLDFVLTNVSDTEQTYKSIIVYSKSYGMKTGAFVIGSVVFDNTVTLQAGEQKAIRISFALSQSTVVETKTYGAMELNLQGVVSDALYGTATILEEEEI